MIRPDELPAATLAFLHPALTSIPAATSNSPRLRAVIAQARSCPAVTVTPKARTAFLTAAHQTSSGLYWSETSLPLLSWCFMLAGGTRCHLPAETANRSTTTQIYEGTNQIQRMVMARQLLK
jgi:alkylation response protein AidB-like acyl-CoA dehydrogenase